MAKVSFNKLGLKIDNSEIPVQIGEETVAVRQYLPIEDKLDLIAKILELAHDTENNFANPVKTDVYMDMCVIEAYTNISFTEKQKDNVPDLYDKFVCSGAWATIKQAIPNEEYEMINYGVYATNDAFYKYRNSVLGILDTIKQDYGELDLNVMDIKEKLNDPQILGVINSLLTKIN